MAPYTHPVSSLHDKDCGRFLTVVAHPQTLHLPSAHTGRDGQKPIQAVRPGGFIRSSGFLIRDAVPARIPTCVVQLTMQLGPSSCLALDPGVWPCHSMSGKPGRSSGPGEHTWGTSLVVSAFDIGRKWLICRTFIYGASRDRTGDLLLAKQALSQLSYGPVPLSVRQLSLFRPSKDSASAAHMAQRRCSTR
jgi:hypothetical protein